MTRVDLIEKIDNVMARGAAAWSRDDMGTTALQFDAAQCLKEAHRQMMATPARPLANYLAAFLRELEARLPPPPGAHHSLTYYCATSRGVLGEQLRLGVWIEGVCVTLFLDDADFEQPAPDLATAAADEAGRLRTVNRLT